MNNDFLAFLNELNQEKCSFFKDKLKQCFTNSDDLGDISFYKGFGYKKINNALWKKESSYDADKLLKVIGNNKNKQAIITIRFTHSKYYQNISKGYTFTFKGFLSSSLLFQHKVIILDVIKPLKIINIDDFDMLFFFLVPQNTKCIAMANELEVIFPPNTNITVFDVIDRKKLFFDFKFLNEYFEYFKEKLPNNIYFCTLEQ